MANILPREKQMTVLQLSVEGAGIRATERITGVYRDTICRLILPRNANVELVSYEHRQLAVEERMPITR